VSVASASIRLSITIRSLPSCVASFPTAANQPRRKTGNCAATAHAAAALKRARHVALPFTAEHIHLTGVFPARPDAGDATVTAIGAAVSVTAIVAPVVATVTASADGDPEPEALIKPKRHAE
jgi:hypothetical protein